MNRAQMLAELHDVLNNSSLNGAFEEYTLINYLSEGQDRFCEKTGYFKDVTNYQLTLAAGISVYDIPERTIQILDIWDGTRKLIKAPDGSEVAATSLGRPGVWRTDQETGLVQLTPIPSTAEAGLVLALQLWRYSRYELSGDGPEAGVDAVPEIPGRFQRACVEWAAYKALNHHDMETQDPVKAADHLKAFNDYVIDGIMALRRIQNNETRIGSDPAYRT